MLQARVGSDKVPVASIHVFFDVQDPPDMGELTALRRMNPVLPIHLDSSEHVSGWGESTVQTEFEAFRKVSRGINDDDLIMKTDSDVLFLDHQIFQLILADSYSDSFFQPVSRKLVIYGQGGCYFLRSRIANKLSFDFERYGARVQEMLDLPDCPEDFCVYQSAVRASGHARCTKFYGKSVLHFEGPDKSPMKTAYEELCQSYSP